MRLNRFRVLCQMRLKTCGRLPQHRLKAYQSNALCQWGSVWVFCETQKNRQLSNKGWKTCVTAGIIGWVCFHFRMPPKSIRIPWPHTWLQKIDLTGRRLCGSIMESYYVFKLTFLWAAAPAAASQKRLWVWRTKQVNGWRKATTAKNACSSHCVKPRTDL